MIRLGDNEKRSLNPAWVESIICVNNKVQIRMKNGEKHLQAPSFSSWSEALIHREHLKLQVEMCPSAPSGKALIYLKSFDNHRIDIPKIEDIARLENDCCVLIKLIDHKDALCFEFHSKSAALRFAKFIEFLVNSRNVQQLPFNEDDNIEDIAPPENDYYVLIKLGHDEIELRFSFSSKPEGFRFAKRLKSWVGSRNVQQLPSSEDDREG